MNDQSNPKDKIGSMKDAIGLLTPEFMKQTSRAMKYGAYEAPRADGTKGYGPYNWRQTKVRYSIYLDASFRHLIELLDRNDLDKVSKLHHAAHIAANMNIILDALRNDCLIDDRPMKPKTESNNTIMKDFGGYHGL